MSIDKANDIIFRCLTDFNKTMAENIRKTIQKVYNAYQKAVAFIGADRLVHLFLSVAATVIGALILLRLKTSIEVWVAATVSAIIVFFFGVLKERGDENYGGGFDGIDLLFDCMGCVLGLAACLWLI